MLVWLGRGFKEALAMVWMTLWPLVLGFTLAGVVQGMIPRSTLRRQLGSDSLRTHATASLLGALSSSCSYAASAMSRALFARGASWTNALIFMVASTNLVIELAVVLFVLLGWPFVIAQIVGGIVMVVILIALSPSLFVTPAWSACVNGSPRTSRRPRTPRRRIWASVSVFRRATPWAISPWCARSW